MDLKTQTTKQLSKILTIALILFQTVYANLADARSQESFLTYQNAIKKKQEPKKAKRSVTKNPYPKGFNFQVSGTLGYGTYPNVPEPKVQSQNLTTSQEQTSIKPILQGFPALIGGGLVYRTKYFELGVNGHFVTMANSISGNESQTYRRWGGGGFVGARYYLFPYIFRAKLGVEYRQASFLKNAGGHYLDTTSVYGLLGGDYKDWLRLEAGMGLGLLQDFGYLNSDNGQSGSFESFTPNSIEYFSKLSLCPSRKNCLVLSAQLEQQNIVLEDTREYEKFGLTLRSDEVKRKNLILDTLIIGLGFSKEI